MIKLHTKYQSLGLLVSDKVFEVLPVWVYVKKLNFPKKKKKRSRSTQGYHFFNFNLAHVPNAAYQAPGSLANWFQRKFLWTRWPSWSSDYDVNQMPQTFIPLAHGGSIWNLALIGLVVSEKTFKSVEVSVVNRGLSVKPGLGYLGYWQTVQTQHLIRASTVCLNYWKFRAEWNSL